MKATRRHLLVLLSALWLAAASIAAELSVATMNCYLYFDPSYDHPGGVDQKDPLTAEEYQQKTTNLISLVQGSNIVALEEIGGKPEVRKLAEAGGFHWCYTKGKDTFTGEQVGLLHQTTGWNVVSRGRVSSLDAVLSKHLHVVATKGSLKVHFLVIHLLRPIGENAAKHEDQIGAIQQWVQDVLEREPKSAVCVLGDTNDTSTSQTESLIGVGTEAGMQNQFQATHLDGKPYDRIIVAGNATLKNIEVVRPPYPPKPNRDTKRVWTDHYVLKAVLDLPE
jgi:hypothetical protein